MAEKDYRKRFPAEVIASDELAPGIISLWLKVGAMAKEARPGQFISMFSADASRMLPRPISICDMDPAQGTLRVVFRIAGAGTKEFSLLKSGDTVDVIGPLGNGYTLSEQSQDPALLVAGGIGIPPMLALAKALPGEKHIVLGYRDSAAFLAEELGQYGTVHIASEDGSTGVRGNVLDAIRSAGLDTGTLPIYACGPKPMLRALKAFAEETGGFCQISLEERMACGIGACLACVCETKETDSHSQVRNRRICKDGPVFDAREVIL